MINIKSNGQSAHTTNVRRFAYNIKRTHNQTPNAPADGFLAGLLSKRIAYTNGSFTDKPETAVPTITRRELVKAYVAQCRDDEIEKFIAWHIDVYGGDAWFDGAGFPVTMEYTV